MKNQKYSLAPFRPFNFPDLRHLTYLAFRSFDFDRI